MATLIDIKKGIVDKLSPLGRVISTEIRSGFEKPAFFVQMMPLGDVTNCNMTTTTIMVNIHYFSKEKTDIDNLKMLDKLRKQFVNVIPCGDRNLTISDRRYDTIDNVLQFTFDIRYTDYIGQEDDVYEQPQDLQIKFD